MDKGIRVGDIVEKKGDMDKGKKGLVLEIETNSLNNSFVTVMVLGETVEKLWYVKLVEVVHETRDVSEIRN